MKKITGIFIIFMALIFMSLGSSSDENALTECSFRQSRIVDYMVVSEGSMDKFNEKIRKEILNGWQPFGSFVTSFRCNYYQAMVKYGI